MHLCWTLTHWCICIDNSCCTHPPQQISYKQSAVTVWEQVSWMVSALLKQGKQDTEDVSDMADWLILMEGISLPHHYQHILLNATSMHFIMIPPSCIKFEAKTEASLFCLLPIMTFFLPHNTMESFYYNGKFVLETSTWTKISVLIIHYIFHSFKIQVWGPSFQRNKESLSKFFPDSSTKTERKKVWINVRVPGKKILVIS